jgi:hypothetical protein
MQRLKELGIQPAQRKTVSVAKRLSYPSQGLFSSLDATLVPSLNPSFTVLVAHPVHELRHFTGRKAISQNGRIVANNIMSISQ